MDRHNILYLRNKLAVQNKQEKHAAAKIKTRIFLQALLQGTHIAVAESIIKNFSY